MCLCIFIRIHVYNYSRIEACIPPCVHIGMTVHICMYICMYLHMYVCMSAFMYYVCMY